MERPYGPHLPDFPGFYNQPVSEDLLERKIERLVDRADAALMDGRATQQQYDAWFVELGRWAFRARQARA